jgi:hypothetical protein
MADHPGLTNILKTTYTVAEDLKPWTSHLNSMFGISILVFIGLMVPLQFILEIFKNVEPQFPITIIVNTIMIFFSFWPLVAIAGFYRICLYPRSEIPTPSYEKPKK